ncbi:putative long-chain-fatty-acid--CoA ligase [Caenibius tardaugens NBRC 16725]|uniref:Putative long-chain-fatty-acid--CoA ligase n=1 Tax=Caenibius tardaugens NBRC 16725 TaxID=1219035 RepID=U2YNG3_9SPHN|nr:AMP-binding protein [Caenibius tardaugens]AZI35604.1 AMP-dependent synthetase [Caenibius tardaugens NBRC 16725]GAD50112.1 putative long-chain-fatty-acid--CoA ligase [Caenibius tardaugens NBRC 16725]
MGDGQSILTMGEMIRSSARSFGDRDAIVFPDCRLTYAELNRAARDWAKALMAMGIKPGDHVGLLLPTCVEFITAFYGITMAGGVAVPINARYQASELGYVVANADLVAVITIGKLADGLDFSERLESALPSLQQVSDPRNLALPEAPRLRGVVCLDSENKAYLIPAGAVLDAGKAVAEEDVDARIDGVSPQDTAMILYTSGTTANPKGAMISHRAQVANSRNLGLRYECTQDDKVWSPLPIFHIAGILPMTMILDLGGSYMTIPRFDAGLGLAMLGREGATIAYPSFVTIMQDLITHPTFKNTDLSRLRVMNSNFAVQPEWIKLAVAEAMPHTIQVGTYGLTEGAGTVSTSRLDDSYEVRTGRCGVPLDEWTVRIVDPVTGKDCGPGEQGEVVLGGPNILKGYYNAPEKTAEAIRDGWFHTGDIGSIDADGNVMFHGRIKDMLKVGGENVAAAEIEAMLQTHPAVKLAQVVGLPDARYAEVPAAFVELAEGETATEQELIAHCRGQIAAFKVPRHVRFVDVWPMSTSKIQKFRLRDHLIAELQLS